MATWNASRSFYTSSHISTLHLDDFASLMTISSSFDSLFKVLFTFPSQYFFAIGLLSIFSFRCGLTPQWFRLQSQTTRLEMTISLINSNNLIRQRGFHALWLPFPWIIFKSNRQMLVNCHQRLQLRTNLTNPDFKSELFHLHSPLLVESLLLSFPPLINMLKFSG